MSNKVKEIKLLKSSKKVVDIYVEEEWKWKKIYSVKRSNCRLD